MERSDSRSSPFLPFAEPQPLSQLPLVNDDDDDDDETTFMLTSSGHLVPYREASRVEETADRFVHPLPPPLPPPPPLSGRDLSRIKAEPGLAVPAPPIMVPRPGPLMIGERIAEEALLTDVAILDADGTQVG